MAKQRSNDTREKLLAAAGEIFAEKGFSDATVAEICGRAEANIAAVNYYFGTKEALYQETWRHAFAESIKVYPPDGGVSRTAPAAERLRGQMRALILRIADAGNREFYIAQREFANPTGLLKEVMKSALIPLHQQTLAVVKEMLGPEADEQQAMFCETCILSICLHPMLMRQARRKAESIAAPNPVADLEAFIDHATKFALAGISDAKEQGRSRRAAAAYNGARPAKSGVAVK